MTRLIDSELLTSKISFASFPHVDRNGRIDKSRVYELINSCPTVEERPQGEWKLYKSPVNRIYQCSCCGKNSPDFTAYMKMNFCPNCGADMRGDDYGS